MKKFLHHKIITFIMKVWPKAINKQVKIQWDNAGPHLKHLSPEIIKECTINRWNITFVNQLAKFPNLNVLHLGLFNAIQTVQYRIPLKNTEDLEAAVCDAWGNIKMDTISRMWYTLQVTMDSVFSVVGNNTYKLKHINKTKMLKEGLLGRNYQSEYRGLNSKQQRVTVVIPKSLVFASLPDDSDDDSVKSEDEE